MTPRRARSLGDQFVAINVGQGDAFFLQRQNRRILVDGGRSVEGFANHFVRTTNCSEVDVLVCTHNDADHANGVIGYLRDNLGVREVWLPGNWTPALEQILSDPFGYPDTLLREIREESADLGVDGEGDLLEQLGPLPPPENDLAPADEGAAERILAALERAQDETWNSPLAPWAVVWEAAALRSRRLRVFVEALSAARRIRDIALLAFRRGATLRWFEFGLQAPGGGDELLLFPLNARELILRRRPMWLLLALRLSVANQRSLVFYSPPSSGGAVLFSADSDLVTTRCPPIEDLLVTAPHHGSETNRNAYATLTPLAEQGTRLTLVRSDGRYRKRPGASYLGLPATRFCTICWTSANRSSCFPRQAVRVSGSGGSWHSAAGTASCRCA